MDVSRRSLAGVVATGLAVVPVLASSVEVAHADQPYMFDALRALQAARAALMNAEPNKGGHRDRALVAIDNAIFEVKAGIEFARGRY